MARITYDQMKNYLGNGGSYFSLKPNEEALIRILYNNNDDVQAFTVHEIRCKNNQTITVDCARLEGQRCLYMVCKRFKSCFKSYNSNI